MWRHLRMLKRGGRSYDATGVDGTSPGELAVTCPACPIPSVNLPPDWKSVGKDSEYVGARSEFGLFLTDVSQVPLLSVVWDRCLLPLQTETGLKPREGP